MCLACCSPYDESLWSRASTADWTSCLASPAPTRPPDRVVIWSSQLAANDFPPVCAMTGAPAETWRKFRFSTAPDWAYAFLLLLCTGVGLLIVFLAIYLVSRRASGYLPLTRASSRRVALASWIPGGLFLLTLLLWVLAIIISSSSNDDTAGAVAGLVLIFSLVVLIAAMIGWLVIRRLIGPRAKVFDRQPGMVEYMVEIRKVHPAFVSAVVQAQHARAAQMAAGASLPLPPATT